jgi:hypothetical protein
MASAPEIDAYITKYALTSGIAMRRVEPVGDNMVRDGWSYFHKNDWHLDRAAAVARAEQMRMRRIAALKKQLQRLEALRFD